jgi:hypothetical protein
MVIRRRGRQEPSPTRSTPRFRELDQRTCAGLTVTLEWDPATDELQIRCEDELAPDWVSFSYPVAPSDARLAFLHPFVLQPRTAGAGEPTANPWDAVETASRRRRRWRRARTDPHPAPSTGTGTAAEDDELSWLWWEI